jgi:biopolymer transport protein ExbD
MEFERRKRISTHLNIAPLIDVVFLLLVFFMLSSHFLRQPGIKISLPAASSAQQHAAEDIVILISENNRLYLNENPVTLEALSGALKSVIAQSEGREVIVKADEKIDLGLAVRVMDIARGAQAEKLVISTRLKDDAAQ